MSEKKATADGRARIWACIVYPESAPTNWRSILDDEHIEWAESPLHDSDVNEGTGELKKAHWHIVLAFDGKKSFDQVSSLVAPLNGTLPQVCHSLKGSVRYFAHLDNPEKFQYSPSDIIGHGGFDVSSALAPNSAQRYLLIREMKDWCWREGITEFSDLLDYASEYHFDDWFPLLCDSCTMVMREYLRSRRFHCSGGRASDPE